MSVSTTARSRGARPDPQQSRRRGATFVAAFGAILGGYDTGIIAGAILFITPAFGLSHVQQGLIISSILMGAVVGSILSGWVAQRLGRKTTLIIGAALFIVSGLAMAFAPSYEMLLLARLAAGLAVGAMEATVPTFLSELAPTKSRGRLATNNQLLIATGILLAGVVNLFFSQHISWRVSLGASAVLAAILLVMLIRQPETPRWLMLQGRRDEARRVLDSLLGRAEAEQAYAELERVSHDPASSPNGERPDTRTMSAGSLLRSRALRPVLITALVLGMLQQLVGINAILYYAPTILKQLGFGTNTALVNTVGFGVLSVVSTIISGLIVDRVGRRRLLIIGSVVLGASMLVVGLVFGLHWFTPVGQIVALAGLAVFKSGFSLTWGPVMWVVLPELFPLRARSAGASLATAAKTAIALIFAFGLAVALASHAVAVYVTFAFFGAVGAVFVWRRVPETGGRSLEELELESLTLKR